MEKKKSSYKKLQEQLINTQNELAKVNNELTEKKPEKKSIRKTIPYQQTLFRIRTDISTFKNAMLMAENIQSPQRTELYRMYKHCLNDAHLNAVILNRKSAILGSQFVIVDKNNQEVENLNYIINSMWFNRFLDLSLDSIFYGYSLIEFSEIKNNEFTDIWLVPRDYVKPEFGIVTQTQGAVTGENFHDKPYSDWCIGVGDTHNLGLLSKSAPYSIWKQAAIMAYSEYVEMAGVPIRILKTDIYDEEMRAMGENFMRNLGNSAYAVIGKDDEVKFAEAGQKGGAEGLFNGLIDKMDEQMSKLILGGTGLLDTKSYVGAAEVHQNNFEQLCRQDKQFILNVLNYQLIPFLINHGFPLRDCKIALKSDNSITDQEFDMINNILKSGAYQIPGEYITEKFGIPIIKEEMIEDEQKEEQEEEKKPTKKIKNNLNIYQPKRRK